MKKIIAFIGFVFLLHGCASAQKGNEEINQKLDSKSDKEIVLIKVISDSRCPEGVQCVWAGEVTIEVAAYENKKLIEQKTFAIGQNPEALEEVKSWFSKHSVSNQELKEVSVLPYPKEGVQVKTEEYKIKLVY